MLKQILMGIILISGVVVSTWGKQPTAVSHLAKTSKKPAFQTVMPTALQEAIQIVSSRSTAAFGFNTPLIRIYLPNIDNSAYAVITFDTPQLLNENGQPVLYDLERGGYDDKLFADEIRLVIPGGTGPGKTENVAYDRVKGTGRIKYPLNIVTRTIRSGKTTNGPAPTLNGSLVTYIDKNIPAMVFQQGPIGPVRAYDATGRQLKRKAYNATQTIGETTQRTLAFSGEIAEVEIDTVTQWIELAFTYDLPPTKPLPESYRGHSVSRPPQITATPGGDVSVRCVSQGTSAPVKNE